MTLIRIDDALKLLTLFRKQRLTDEERVKIDHAVGQLRRAKVDPGFFAWLHLPLNRRKQPKGAE